MMVMDSCCSRKPNKKQKRDKYGEVLNIISYSVFLSHRDGKRIIS